MIKSVIQPPLKVVHVITDLDLGGAEWMLYRLTASFDKNRVQSTIISLRGLGVLTQKFKDMGNPVFPLFIDPNKPNPLKFFPLVRLLNQIKPDLVHTWMYHADFFGGLAAKLAGSPPVIWGIRNLTFDPRNPNLRTKGLVWLNARLSKWLPAAIISNSNTARDLHIKLGYAKSKMIVIPNGFDLSEYAPNKENNLAFRKEIGVEQNTPLIGLIARHDPLKDHPVFAEAASILKKKLPHVQFVLAGTGIDWDNPTISSLIFSKALQSSFHLLGARTDIPRVMASLDILTSSSYSESFPNVVGEAMASEVPCVVTDVGDSKLLVGDTGIVIEPKNPVILADAWEKLLKMSPKDRAKLGQAARKRIRKYFSLETIAAMYLDFYEEVNRKFNS